MGRLNLIQQLRPRPKTCEPGCKCMLDCGVLPTSAVTSNAPLVVGLASPEPDVLVRLETWRSSNSYSSALT